MLASHRILIAGKLLACCAMCGNVALARQPDAPRPKAPSATPTWTQAANESAPPKPEFNYGVGYAVPWQAASGVHWRKNARWEYYSNPPVPAWRWFTKGRGCPYDPGLHYGIGYPFTVGYEYPKYNVR